MIHKRKLLLGIFSQGVSILAPFIVIFLSARYLSKAESSIWILFLSTTSLMMLFDFGFSPTIIRYISYVTAGAQSITRIGIDGIVLNEKVNHPLLNRLIVDFNKVYTVIAVIATVLLGGGGFIYFKMIVPIEIRESILVAWGVFSIGLACNIKYLYLIPLLTGLSKIEDTYLANLFSKLIWVLFTLVLLNIKASILWLSVGYLFSVISGRILLHYFLNYKPNIWLLGKNFGCQQTSTLAFIYSNTWRLGLVGLGGFLINRGTVYLAGIVDNLEMAAQYALSVQMFFSIMAVVNVLINQLMPILSEARVAKNIRMLRKSSMLIYLFTVFSFSIISSVFILSNEWVLSLFKVKIHFLPNILLFYLAVVFLLEISHSTCATIITTKNEVPFVSAALISGILVIVISSILSISFSLGVLGLILGQGGVQLLYNNWKWPYVLYKDLMKPF